MKSNDLILGYCKEEFLPQNRGFDTFFGQWTHAVDYYTRKSRVKGGNKGQYYDIGPNDYV